MTLEICYQLDQILARALNSLLVSIIALKSHHQKNMHETSFNHESKGNIMSFPYPLREWKERQRSCPVILTASCVNS